MDTICISKSFTFDMAHALYAYDGLCKNIHGHTYHLTVSLEGIPLQQTSHAKDGMVMDFKLLKQIIQKEILDLFDHALVLNGLAQEHVQLKEKIQTQFEKIIFLECQPTAENLLIHFKNKILPYFNETTKLVYMKLMETPTSWVEWKV